MEIMQFFIQLQQQFRTLHWETKSYARHKAYGEIYDSLDDLIDTFMETHMGKYGRPKFETVSIELKAMKNVKVNDFIGESIDFLNGLTQKLDEKDTDLLNIRDEMLGDLNKLKYLLTLK
jgi:DNA-binding ferritin-like protein